MRDKRFVLLLTIPLVAFLAFSATARAQIPDPTDATNDTLKQQVDDLNAQVKEKRSRVKELDGIIANYKGRIAEQESRQASLENEVLLLDNRITKIQLDIERSKVEAEALQLEINALETNIEAQTRRIAKEKDFAAEIIRRVRAMDGVSPLEVLLTKKSLSAFFDRLTEIKRLESDLADALQKVKGIRRELENRKKEMDAKRVALVEENKRMKKQQMDLEAERGYKTSLAAETALQQSEFERALYELRQQQQSASDDISSIESSLKDKLDSIDESLARGDVLLNWPLPPRRGVSAHFHDPTYPFRNLFEHPGTDIPTPVGSPVRAAAGGYVAWTKRGRLYGNYIMIVHPGNIATVYAHLSRFIAKPDTYVDRGTIIGESGGRPGDPGAGLSSGPHLHFEVRLNGIPVNAENYLPSLPGEEQ